MDTIRQSSLTDFFASKKNSFSASIKKDKARVSELTPKSSLTSSEDSIPKKRRRLDSSSRNTPVNARKRLQLSQQEEIQPSFQENVRKKLLSAGKLGELKQRLAAVQAAKLDCSSTQQAQPVSVEPAYKRFHGLTQESALPLPFSYRQLAEYFRCCDTVVSILYNRKELCTFEKVKKSVEDMIKKTFTKTKLAQIKTVLPEAYRFHYEKVQQALISRTSEYHLVITPILEQDNVMSPKCLVDRRAIFHSNLLCIVKEHHAKFLMALSPPVVIATESIKRWHPRFPVDVAPSITPGTLPEAPDSKTCTSALDILAKVRGKLNDRIEKALESVTPTVPAEKKEAKNNIQGISQDILARIRAKEAFKVAQEMTRKPEEEREHQLMSHVPETVRVLRTFFLSERKAAIQFDTVVNKLQESLSFSVARQDIEQHIHFTSKILPDWLFILTIQRGTFLKIDKSKDVNDLIERVNRRLK